MAKSKRQPAPKPKKRRVPWLRIVTILSLFGAACVTALYLWVDHKVVSSLKNRDLSKLSSIYSVPLRISAVNLPSTQALKIYLDERHYREVPGQLTLPGEYRFTPDQLLLFTREFRGPHSDDIPSIKLSIDLKTGRMMSLDGSNEELRSILLEPKIISNLGSGSQRASSYKKLAEIPEHVRNAVIAVEDERFLKHMGVDPIGILRAMFENLKALDFVQGGSTITQQLAKNILFTPEKTVGRKFLEMFAAVSLERHLTKDQILEMYLNEIYLGQEGPFALHGVAEAGNAFFGRGIEELNAAEGAMLAGIIRAPSTYSPRRHLERAIERKNVALDRMRELGYLTDKQYQTEKLRKLQIVEEARNKRGAPFFTAALEAELGKHFSLDAAVLSGMSVFTGINNEMQECAEKAVPDGLAALEKKFTNITKHKTPIEAALVAIEPHSGLIKAWVGGRDFSVNQFNHVNQAERQIGSTIKPFLYLTALDSNLNNYKVASATSILSDEPTKVDLANAEDWTPENYDHSFRGDVTLRYALENSLNLPAVYVSQRVGIQSMVNTLANFRIAANIPAVPSVALGAVDTSLLRLTAAYAALANGGRYVAPRLYISALDANSEVIAASNIEESQLGDERAVFVLTNILQGVLARGTAKVVRAMGYERPAAGKTGTSNDTRDAWFVGFTPNISVGVWVGFDDNSKIGYTGGTLAAPIWTQFMQCIEKYHEPLDFLKPDGVVITRIDKHSLELATDQCPADDIVAEYYVSGTEPTKRCHLHYDQPEDVPPPPTLEGEEIPSRRKSFWDRVFG